MIDWIDRRLDAWGAWSLEHSIGLGYPSRTLMHRIQEQGPTGAAIKSYRLDICPPEAVEEIERAILSLPDNLRHAILIRYLHPHWPTQVCASEVGVSRDGFYQTMERAHHWIAGWLSVG